MPKQPSNPAKYFSVAHSLALQAGSIIKSTLRLGIKREWKSDQTPVTIVDQQINQLVIDTIHKEFPGHSILAEEGSDLSRSKEYVWVCDPIDGTFPFMHGIPVSTFTIALVQNGQPILGLIYDPCMDRLFTAQVGQGTKLNNNFVKPLASKNMDKTTVGVVFWQDNIKFFAPLLVKLTNSGAKIIDLCSVAYMDAVVAAGELSAVIFPGFSAHDSAAAKIILEEAGGVFSSLTGEVDRYDRPVHGHIAAANRAIYAQIQSLLR
jgi:myo-inositol-1(or 4)-monophosphatase